MTGLGDGVLVSRGLAHVAQSVECVLGKDEVTGSIPVVGTRRSWWMLATVAQDDSATGLTASR